MPVGINFPGPLFYVTKQKVSEPRRQKSHFPWIWIVIIGGLAAIFWYVTLPLLVFFLAYALFNYFAHKRKSRTVVTYYTPDPTAYQFPQPSEYQAPTDNPYIRGQW